MLHFRSGESRWINSPKSSGAKPREKQKGATKNCTSSQSAIAGFFIQTAESEHNTELRKKQLVLKKAELEIKQQKLDLEKARLKVHAAARENHKLTSQLLFRLAEEMHLKMLDSFSINNIKWPKCLLFQIAEILMNKRKKKSI